MQLTLKITVLLALAFISFGAFSQKGKKSKINTKGWAEGIYANFETDKGSILIKLEHEKTPMTVANFVGLAEGKFQPFDSIKFSAPFFNGLKFHRVIAKFMIQGGDPKGNGSGDPGYKFYDEIHPDLKHSGPGILSMANSGIHTNGSQFFITHKDTPWLDGKHTVFGQLISGQEVVDAIEQNDLMKTVTIIRVGKAAKKFDATKVFQQEYAKKKPIAEKQLADQKAQQEEQMRVQRERQEAQMRLQKEKEEAQKKEAERIRNMGQQAYLQEFREMTLAKYPNAKMTNSGLMYVINEAGSAEKPTPGTNVTVHYTGYLTNGTKFDSSKDRGTPFQFVLGQRRVIAGWDEGIPLLGKGGKGTLIIPYFLGYGEGGSGPIPAFATLIFDVELLDF